MSKLLAMSTALLFLLGCKDTSGQWKKVSKNGQPCAAYRLHDRTWEIRTELGTSVIPVEDPTAEKDVLELVKNSCGGGDLKTQRLQDN